MKANKLLVHHRDGISVAVKVKALLPSPLRCGQLVPQRPLTHSRARPAAIQVRGEGGGGELSIIMCYVTAPTVVPN